MNEERFKNLIDKVSEMKKTGSVDLSTEEDLSLAIMNLISLEEHFFFTGAKTKKPEYFDFLNEIRNLRKGLMEKMLDRNEGETWCVSKHLLSATMRLIEVGTKLQSDGKKEEAREIFSKAYKIYSIFWALRLKLVGTKELKGISSGQNPDSSGWSVEDIVNKLVDCCDEK